MPRKRPGVDPVDPPEPGWSTTLAVGADRHLGDIPAPRTGEPVTYAVSEDIGGVETAYGLRIPAGAPQVDLNSTIVVREGEAHGDDFAYQEGLFNGVGRVAVASGLVEAALKRVLIVLAPDKSAFDEVDMDWKQLEEAIRDAARGAQGSEDGLADSAVRLLVVAEKQGLRTGRNDVVHGEWWAFAGMDGRLNRWPRRNVGHTTTFPLDDLTLLGRRLLILAESLNRLVSDHWPMIMLPPIEHRSNFHRASQRTVD